MTLTFGTKAVCGSVTVPDTLPLSCCARSDGERNITIKNANPSLMNRLQPNLPRSLDIRHPPFAANRLSADWHSNSRVLGEVPADLAANRGIPACFMVVFADLSALLSCASQRKTGPRRRQSNYWVRRCQVCQ